MKKVYIESLGCVPRSLEAKRLEKYFIVNGFKRCHSPRTADLIIFNTCAFVKSTGNYCLKRIQQLQKYRVDLIVTGCLKDINKKQLDNVFSGDSFGPLDLESIDRLFPSFKYRFTEIKDDSVIFQNSIKLSLLVRILRRRFALFNLGQLYRKVIKQFNFNRDFFSKVMRFLINKLILKKINMSENWFIRISWGCLSPYCSYCVIYKSIGRLKSKPIELCLSEFKRGLEKGFKKFYITADNIGAYGLDIKKTLPELLEAILTIQGKYSLIMDNLDPQWAIGYLDRLIPLIGSNRIESIHTPIQSGNNRILKLMNRQYTAQETSNTFLKFKSVAPNLKLFANIMIGFPSETESDFHDTLEIVKKIGFYYVVMFPYSEQEGMFSARLPDKVSPEVIKFRINKAKKYFKDNNIDCYVLNKLSD